MYPVKTTGDKMNTRPTQPKSRKKSKVRHEQNNTPQFGGLVIETRITPKTSNQKKMMDLFRTKDVVVAHGFPGSGKTLLAVYLALNELEKNPTYKKVIILRSSVSSREMGHLPGKPNEKMAEYEAPYSAISTNLYGRGDAWQLLKQKGVVQFSSTAFLRGMTFDDCIVIMDEFQNMGFQELSTIMTRFGNNCKMIVIGDTGQDDLTSERYKEKSGAVKLLHILDKIPEVGMVEMGVDDIVRSGFVKSFIMAQYSIKSSEYSDF